MHHRLLPFAALLLLAPLVSQGQEKTENPFKTAKIGDYVAYKLTTSLMGKDIDVNVKQTVTAQDEKEATLKTTTAFMGIDLPAQITKIDLTKPYDITAAATQGAEKGKFEKTGEGKEKVKVGDKTYDCNWLTGKVVAEAMGQKLESEVKVWFSKAVPLTGLVKLDMKSNLANVKMEIAESGSAK